MPDCKQFNVLRRAFYIPTAIPQDGTLPASILFLLAIIGVSSSNAPQEWMTDDRLPLCNVHSINIGTNDHLKSWHNRLNKKAGGIKLGLYKLIHFPKEKQGAMQTVIGQLLSRNPVAGSIRQISNRYTEKQRQVMQVNTSAAGVHWSAFL
ncbi:hypothetical protein T06_16920 [Trichinella sp. T6]|nr:hypothetical protein T06_16920 [Trichinella sp. T6]